MTKHFALAAALLAAGVSLTGCYDGYGYGGVDVGYSPGYYNSYGGYGDYYDSGYGSPWGWYGDYYYPGSGVYVYDRDRRPYRWSRDQQRYWGSRSQNGRGDRDHNEWRGFDRGSDGHSWNRSANPGSDYRGGDSGRYHGSTQGYRGNSQQGYRGSSPRSYSRSNTPSAVTPTPSAPSSGYPGATSHSYGGGSVSGGTLRPGGQGYGSRGRH